MTNKRAKSLLMARLHEEEDPEGVAISTQMGVVNYTSSRKKKLEVIQEMSSHDESKGNEESVNKEINNKKASLISSEFNDNDNTNW